MKFTRQNLILVGIGVIVVGLLVWAFLPTPVEVDLGTVERGSLMVTVDHEGKTRVRDRYVVSSPLTGNLLRIDYRAGDTVSAGKSLLAVLEPTDPTLLDVRTRTQAETRVDATKAARKQASINLQRARVQLAQAEAELTRARRLRPTRSMSDQEYESIAFREQTATAEVRSAEFALQVAEFEQQQAEAALIQIKPTKSGSPGEITSSRFDIRSPISGAVLRVFQESAAVVNPGTKLLELGDLENLECEIDVLSADAVKIKRGQRVILEHWGGEKPLEGTVRVREPSGFTKISALGVEEQRVNIIVDFKDPPSKRPTLGDAYRVEARIVIWESPSVRKISAGALFRREGEWAVFKVQEGRATLQKVKIGHSNGLETEILDGLEENDQIVLHPSDRVIEGVAVAPRPGR